MCLQAQRGLAALAVVAIFLLQACTTYDPYTSESESSNAAVGAAISAGVSALGAYIDNKDEDSRKRNQRILATAGGGAAIGGGIGYYMDLQEAMLRKKLRSTGVRVLRDGDSIKLTMPGHITFSSNSSDIASSFYAVLESVALVIEQYDQTSVAVAGHTYSSGSDAHNDQLSLRRATSVSGYLKSQRVAAARLLVNGFGEHRPLASNQTAEGKQRNRLVEITLHPIAQH